jgi:hypothetical protein
MHLSRHDEQQVPPLQAAATRIDDIANCYAKELLTLSLKSKSNLLTSLVVIVITAASD